MPPNRALSVFFLSLPPQRSFDLYLLFNSFRRAEPRERRRRHTRHTRYSISRFHGHGDSYRLGRRFMLHFFPRLISWLFHGTWPGYWYCSCTPPRRFSDFARLRYCLHNPLLLFFVEKNARKNARMPHDTQARVKTRPRHAMSHTRTGPQHRPRDRSNFGTTQHSRLTPLKSGQVSCPLSEDSTTVAE